MFWFWHWSPCSAPVGVLDLPDTTPPGMSTVFGWRGGPTVLTLDQWADIGTETLGGRGIEHP